MTTSTTRRFPGLLPLFLVLQACSGGGGHKGDDSGLPTEIFDLAGTGAGVGGAGGTSAPTTDAGGLTLDEDAGVTATPDAEVPDSTVPDSGLVDADVADAALEDASTDAGAPAIRGTCTPCTVDDDCDAPYLCKMLNAEKVCLGPRVGMDYACSTYPGSTYLYGPGSSCAPFDHAAFNYITCDEWHMRTGL